MNVALHKTLIPVDELRQLIGDLSDKRPDICIRFRLLGEMWIIHFLRVMKLTEKGGLFFDENNHLVSIADLNFIMQFELDKPFQGFQPFYHYEVSPSLQF